MNNISCFNFIEYEEFEKHQRNIDLFFKKNVDKKNLMIINSDENNYFKLNSKIGEREMTILGSNEKDYHFYNESFLKEASLNRMKKIIYANKIDNINIPLLTKKGAKKTLRKISNVVDDFIFEINLGSVIPIIDKKKFAKNKSSYQKEIRKFEKNNFKFKKLLELPKIKKLHEKRWGNNRKDSFYLYLKHTFDKNYAVGFGLFEKNELKSYIHLIITGNTVHYYYSIFDENCSGSGSAIIKYAIKYFLESENFNYFSFGRGSEDYKHRWSTDILVNYEVKGFLNKNNLDTI